VCTGHATKQQWRKQLTLHATSPTSLLFYVNTSTTTTAAASRAARCYCYLGSGHHDYITQRHQYHSSGFLPLPLWALRAGRHGYVTNNTAAVSCCCRRPSPSLDATTASPTKRHQRAIVALLRLLGTTATSPTAAALPWARWPRYQQQRCSPLFSLGATSVSDSNERRGANTKWEGGL
jgi:hypothetical protein